MVLLLSGINHKTAPVEVREHIAFDKMAVHTALNTLKEEGVLKECLILSTCNRSEIYGVLSEGEETNGYLPDFFHRYHQLQPSQVQDYFYHFSDEEAVNHLFRVAAGLDSMVVGEAQILGQVREAYSLAVDQRTTGAVLNKLLHQAFHVGKRARSETRIGCGAVSVGSAAVELAKKIFKDLGDKTVLVIGAGEMAALTAKHLLKVGVKTILVTNRTRLKAERLAGQIDAQVIPFAYLGTGLLQTDVVISSTGSPEFILTCEDVRQIMAQRKNRPLFLIDIAVPRDIDPELRHLYNVYLYNIDDLNELVAHNLGQRQHEIPKVEAIVAEEVAKFMAWYDSLRLTPIIRLLQKHFEEIRRREVLRNRKHFLQEDWEQMEVFSRSLLKKFLHSPIMRLKSCTETNNRCQRCTVEEIFGLDAKK